MAWILNADQELMLPESDQDQNNNSGKYDKFPCTAYWPDTTGSVL